MIVIDSWINLYLDSIINYNLKGENSMIRDVINVFENLVNSVQCVGAFIGESLYWMPISVEEGQGTVLFPFLQKN